MFIDDDFHGETLEVLTKIGNAVPAAIELGYHLCYDGGAEAAIARGEQVNPVINAIVHKQYGQARKAVAAGLPEGPLKGVPYLLKDLGFFETGELVTFGSSLFKDFVADHVSGIFALSRRAWSFAQS